MRRYQESIVFSVQGVAGEHVEEIRNVFANIRVTGQKSKIFIQSSGFRVIVTGTDVTVPA
jgi:hypothetical protein